MPDPFPEFILEFCREHPAVPPDVLRSSLAWHSRKETRRWLKHCYGVTDDSCLPRKVTLGMLYPRAPATGRVEIEAAK